MSNRGAVAKMDASARALAIYFVFLLAFCFTTSHPVVNLSPAEYASQQQAILEDVDIFPPEWNISGGASSDQNDGRGKDLSKPVFQAAIVNPGDSAAAGNLEMTDNSVQQAGYFDTDASSRSRIFFWMFPSQRRPSEDPVIIWLQGGPGASGLYGILNQWGPKRIKRRTKPAAGQPKWDFDDNPYRLDQKATVIFIDQPLGTGFSYSEHNPPRVVSNSKAAVNDLIWWIGKFRQTTFQTRDGPHNFADNPLHIVGPSYSGHIIPLLAQQIMVLNVYPALKSILIGNGMTDLALQVPHVIDMACETDTYTPPRPDYIASNCDTLKTNLENCQKKLVGCNPGGACSMAWSTCDRIYTAYQRDVGLQDDDIYDLDTTTMDNKPPNLRGNQLVETYVNARRNQFGITDRDMNGMGHDFRITDGTVVDRFDAAGDHSVSYRRSLSYLLDKTNVKVMLYAVSFFSANSSAASPSSPGF